MKRKAMHPLSLSIAYSCSINNFSLLIGVFVPVCIRDEEKENEKEKKRNGKENIG